MSMLSSVTALGWLLLVVISMVSGASSATLFGSDRCASSIGLSCTNQATTNMTPITPASKTTATHPMANFFM